MKTTSPPPQNCPNNGMRKFSLMRLNTAKLFPSPVTNYFRSRGRKQHNNAEQCRATQRQRIDPEPWDKSFAFPQNAWKRLLTSVPPCLTPLSGVCCSGHWKKNEANKCFWKRQFLKANLLRWGLSTIKHKTLASQLETKCQTFTQSTSLRLFPQLSREYSEIGHISQEQSNAMLSNEIPWDKGSPHLFYPTISQHISISQEVKLPTPQPAMFILGCKKSGSTRMRGKMLKLVFTVFCLVFILYSIHFQGYEIQKNGQIPIKRGYKHGHQTRKSIPPTIHPPKAVASWWPAPPGHGGTDMVFGGTFHTALSLWSPHSITPVERSSFLPSSY